MYVISNRLDKCDVCEKSSDAGYAVVVQGATGRWCEVLWICQECLPYRPGIAYTEEDARERAASIGGTVDF